MDRTGLEGAIRRVDLLMNADRNEEALEVVDDNVPDALSAGLDPYGLLMRRALLLGRLDRHDECFTTLADLIDRGYPVPLHWRRFKPLEDRWGMEALRANNSANLAQAQSSSTMEYEVHLPGRFNKGRAHPVLFALHGDGLDGCIPDFREQWPPDSIVGLDVILVYVQSSQVLLHQRFGWMGDLDQAARDLYACYQAVASKYLIDQEKVIVAGFSGGAIASLHIALASDLPCCGFIAMCPGIRPTSVTSDSIVRAAGRGVKGVVLEGEKEPPSEEETVMMREFDRYGLSYRYIVNEGVGHEVPPDLADKLSICVPFLMDQAER